MNKTVRILKIVGVCFGVLVLAVVVVFGIILLRLVSPEEAQKASQKHFDDVKAKVMAVPGYKIVKEGRPTATSIRDEIGSTDYTLSANFLVQKLPSGSTENGVKADSADFARQLPSNDYGISVENAPQAGGQTILLCVSASRYLNDDGTYIPQGSTVNNSKYISKDELAKAYISSCTDLLR